MSLPTSSGHLVGEVPVPVDYSALTRGFQQGANFAQDFRRGQQEERARDYALKRMGQEDFAFEDNQRRLGRDMQSEFGDVDVSTYQHEGLQDPLAFKLWNWIKGRGKKKKAGLGTVAVGEPVPDGSEAGYDDNQLMYADGGEVDEKEAVRRRAAQNRARRPASIESSTESVQGADRTAKGASRTRSALRSVDEAVGKATGRAAEGSGMVRRAAQGAKRIGALGALAGTALEAGSTSTDDYRERFGMEPGNMDTSPMADVGVRALGAASDLGNLLTFGAAGHLYRDKQRKAGASQPEPETPEEEAAPDEELEGGGGPTMYAGVQRRQRSAIKPSPAAQPEAIDFSDVDADPAEIPDMKTEDWRHFRLEALRAAQLKGLDPATAKEQVNDQVTRMQQKGFMNYATQGLMLQQAGNIRGAMAAYRAAYQYFPTGYDVEFGIHKGKDGRQVIVGFGVDEKTGQRTPGTEMVMDPERAATLIENFKNPQAFRLWTKDWRDFKQDERKYEEVTKPLAQAQADAYATNSEANVLRAENAALRASMGGGYKQSDMRGDAAVFREAPGIQQMMLEDPQQAQYLLNVMGRIKQMRPQIPPDAVASAVMNAVQKGNLEGWLRRLGVNAQATSAPAPSRPAAPARRTALAAAPAGAPSGGVNTPDNPNMSPERLAEYDKYAR